MSSTSLPISGPRFAAALPDLPLSSLYAKTSELRNSIAHLKISNEELKPYAEEGDSVCSEAIQENSVVIGNMEERIQLLKVEVESRGFHWDDLMFEGEVNGANGGVNEGEGGEDGAGEVVEHGQEQPQNRNTRQDARGTGGRLGDEELARLLREQIDDGDGDGLYL